jgi:hypothetical protein
VVVRLFGRYAGSVVDANKKGLHVEVQIPYPDREPSTVVGLVGSVATGSSRVNITTASLLLLLLLLLRTSD